MMKIKKVIVLAGLLLMTAHNAFAERRKLYLHHYRKSNPEKNMEVNRAPMYLPIEVVYDSDTQEIEVTASGSIEAEVYLYDADGSLENYSPTLSANFTVPTPGAYIIQIQGDGWYAEGEIEVEPSNMTD